MEQIAWRDLLASLSASSGDSQKCQVRLLDSIFRDENGELAWYFTTKSGSISRKKPEGIKAPGILDRFTKFALANPQNIEKIVAVMIDPVSGRKTLGEREFSEYVANIDSFTSSGPLLQVYIRPLENKNVIYIFNATKDSDGIHNMSTLIASNGKTTAVDASTDPHAQQALDYGKHIIEYLHYARHILVENISVELIVDDNHHVWLSNVTNCQAIESNDEFLNFRAESAKVSSSNLGLPQLKPHAANTGAIDSRPGSRSGSSSTSSRGIIFKDTSGYRCNLGPDDVPGLRAWQIANVSSGGAKIDWNIDLSSYVPMPAAVMQAARQGNDSLPQWSYLDSDFELRVNRSALRVVENLFLVNICRQADGNGLLCGLDSIQSREDFEQHWRKTYADAVSQFGRDDNSEVIVCGNLHAICRKIDSLIASQFRSASHPEPSTKATSTKMQQAESVVSLLGVEGVTRPKSDTQLVRSASRTGGTRTQEDISAAPAGPIVGWDEESATVVSRRSNENQPVAGDDTLLRNGESSRGGNPAESKKVLKSKKMKAAYSVDSTSTKLKPKDSEESSRSFKRTGINEPPNVELIAKFAAEKEKYLRQGEDKPMKQDPGSQVKGSELALLKKRAGQKSDEKKARAGYPPRSYGQDGPYNNIDPGQDWDQMTAEEKRIAQLEAIAQQEAEMLLHHRQARKSMGQQTRDELSYSNLNNSSVVSNSEADFMARQLHHGVDYSSLHDGSVVGLGEAVFEGSESIVESPIQKKYKTGGQEQNPGNKVILALRERIAELEKQAAQWQQASRKKEEELTRIEDKLKKTALELEAVRKSSAKSLQHMEDEHQRELLRLREQHSKEMAFIATSGPSNAYELHKSSASGSRTHNSPQRTGSQGPYSPSRVVSSNDAAYEANKGLMDQLEALRNEHRKLIDRVSDEKRTMQIEANTKLMGQERQFKAEIVGLRARVTELEDLVSSKDEEVAVARGKVESITNLNKTLERAKLDAIEQQHKLRADLKNMQQSVTTSFRLEASQGLAPGVDAETTIRLNDAKAEAKNRQLMNKLDFMKAQLETEQSASEDLRKALEASRLKFEDLKVEFNLRMHEAEAAKRTAVSEAEARIEGIYEERMMELTTLQSKLMMVQGQLQEAFQEGSLYKQREDTLRAATQKAQAQLAASKAETEALLAQVNELREEREKAAERDAEKPNQDAVLRRLDNERQYLKSQLSSEMTHKAELQKALSASQHQLAEVQRQWRADVEVLKETMANDQRDAVAVEQRMKLNIVRLESEETRLKAQCKDLKEAFTKMRDQLRMEQLTIENLHSTQRDLKDELEICQSEIARLRNADSISSSMHKQQIAALNETIAEQETRRAKEIQTLREELSKQYNEVSRGQHDVLDIRIAHEKERAAATKAVCVLRLNRALRVWRSNRISSFFRTWSTNSTLVGVANQFREQLNILIQDTIAKCKDEKTKALSVQEAAFRKEMDAMVVDLNSRFEDRVAGLRTVHDAEKQQAIDETNAARQKELEDREDEFYEEMQKLRLENSDALAKAGEKTVLELEKYAARVERDNEMAAAREAKKIEEMRDLTIQAQETLWSEKMKTLEGSLYTAKAMEIAKMKNDFAETQRLAAKSAQETLVAKVKELETARAQAIEAVEADHAQRVVKMKADFEKEKQRVTDVFTRDLEKKLSACRTQAQEENETRIRELRKAWTEEFDSKIAEKDAANEELLAKKMAEHSMAVEVERVRGLKLEASKWKQALKDAEQRFVLDVEKSRQEGRIERDNAFVIERKQIDNAHKMQLMKLSEEHREKLASLEMEHADALAVLRNQLEVAKEEAVSVMEATTKRQLNEYWEDKNKSDVQQAYSDSAAMYKSKVEMEQLRLENFKKDVSSQMQRIAEERNALQYRLDQSESLMRKMEATKLAEIAEATKDFDVKFREQEKQFHREKREALDLMSKQQSEATVALEAKFKEEADEKILTEKQNMKDELEEHIKKMQGDSEKLISSLEVAMGDLRKEKFALSKELESVTTKLENTEDALYDLQQESKKKDKSFALATWKLLTGVQKMKINFQEGLAAFQKQAVEDMDKAKKEVLKRSDSLALAGMKLSCLLSEVELVRKRIAQVLTTHKTDFLGEKRTQIKLAEKEIERICTERDAFEQERDYLEEEIEQLEGQVKACEEQIREHNRSSSMQNGRVNVAHARKKKRLDAELERLLDLIEQKRIQMGDLDEQSAEKSRLRDLKELQMVEWERELVAILVEQQRMVLGLVEESKTVDERGATIAKNIRLPWPCPANPTLADVLKINKEIDEENAKRELF